MPTATTEAPHKIAAAVTGGTQRTAASAASRPASSAARSDTGIIPSESRFTPRGVFSGISKTAGHLSTLMFFGPMLGGLLGWASKKGPAGAQPHLEKAATAVRLPEAQASGFTDAVGEVFGHSSTVTKVTGAASEKISTFAQKTLGSGVQERLSQNSVGNLVTSGTFAALGTANLAFDTSKKVSVLKNMYRDLTGGQEISTMSLLMGRKLPPLMQAARREAFGGSALLGMGAQLTEIGTNLYFLGSKSQPGLFKQMAVSMGLSMVPAMLTSGHTGLAGYDAVRQLGQNASSQAYMSMIGGLAPKNTTNQAVEELAKQCVTHKASSADVIQLVNEAFYSGKRPAVVGQATAKLTAQSAGLAQTGNVDKDWLAANQSGEWAAKMRQQENATQLAGARGA